MKRIGRREFVEQFQNKTLSLETLTPVDKKKMAQVGTSVAGLSQADLNQDGKIHGPEEVNALFDYLDRFEHGGSGDELLLETNTGTPSTTGKITTVLRYLMNPDRHKDPVLDVPFYPQTDNYTMPHRTCNSSASAMAAKFLGANLSGDDEYLRRVLSYGDTTDHGAQTRALRDYGINSSFHYNLDFDDLDRSLAEGKPVVIGINHRGPRSRPTGGHMVTVIGKKGDDYVVHDPYGDLNDGYSSSVYNGKGAVYSRAELQDRWLVEGAGSGWGRLFD